MTDDRLPTSSASPLSERVYDELGGRRPETVAAFDNPVMAEMAKARLESEGLAVQLADEHTVGIAGHLATAIGGVKVQVPEEDAGHAREILANLDSIDLGDPEEYDPPTDLERRTHEDKVAVRAPTATRAMRAAVFSFFLPPLVLVSLYFAARYAASDEEGGRGRNAFALALDAFLISIYALMFSRLL
jgi:hypothetical protein